MMDAAWFAIPVVLVGLMSIPIAVIIAIGAHKMLRLESHGLAVFACLAAMLPCHPGWLIGLPIGIWGLMVLNRPEVKAGFKSVAADRQQAKWTA